MGQLASGLFYGDNSQPAYVRSNLHFQNLETYHGYCQRNIWTPGDVVVDPLTAGSCYFEADDSGHEAKDSTSWLEFSPNMQV